MEAHAAFDEAEVFRRHHRDVYRAALRVVGSPQEAEDVAQDAMLRALGALRRERPRRLRPWLLAIARHEALDSVAARRPALALDDRDVPGTAGAEEEALRRDALRELLADVAALPARQREALIAREVDGLGYAEMARRLGVREATARQAVLQARAGLQARAAGRAQPCGEIRDILAGPDRRRARAVTVRAHLEACAGCREAQAGRPARILFPAPLLWLAQLLSRTPAGGLRSPGLVALALVAGVGGVQLSTQPPSPGGDRPAAISVPGQPGAAAQHPAEGQVRLADLRPARERPRPRGLRRVDARPGGTGPGAAAPAAAPAVAPAAAPADERPATEPAEREEPAQQVSVGGVEVAADHDAAPGVFVGQGDPAEEHEEDRFEVIWEEEQPVCSSSSDPYAPRGPLDC